MVKKTARERGQLGRDPITGKDIGFKGESLGEGAAKFNAQQTGQVFTRPTGTLADQNVVRTPETALQSAYQGKVMEDAKIKQMQQAPVSETTQQAVQSVGVLSPEQQAVVDQPVSNKLDLRELSQQVGTETLKSQVSGAAIGATGGAGLGAIGAPVTAGLSIGAGAALGAAGGALVGTVKGVTFGTFAAITRQKKENVNVVESNISKAQYNIKQAIALANKGGDEEVSLKAFNDAVAELRYAERQYKEQSKDSYAWTTNVKEKQIILTNYLQNTLPIQEERMRLSLMKPNPAYVDNGLDANGEPL